MFLREEDWHSDAVPAGHNPDLSELQLFRETDPGPEVDPGHLENAFHQQSTGIVFNFRSNGSLGITSSI